jgi:hypothetical protein
MRKGQIILPCSRISVISSQARKDKVRWTEGSGSRCHNRDAGINVLKEEFVEGKIWHGSLANPESPKNHATFAEK